MSKAYSEAVIAKSFVKGQENWSGKEFSSAPAKIYNNFWAIAEDLNHYWFVDTSFEDSQHDQRSITITHLSEKQKQKLLAEGKIRW